MSHYNAGVLYRDGLGCEQSCKRAAKWFVKGALQEEANSMVELGRLLIQGKGVPQNVERGAELMKRAALQGNIRGQCNLASCYETGTGVTMDYLEARRLYTLFSAQGDRNATKCLTSLEEKIRTECPLLGKQVVIVRKKYKELYSKAGFAACFDRARNRYVVVMDKRTGTEAKV